MAQQTFRRIEFSNFKSLKDYSVSLREMNVLVGPNNAGKSTILDALRLLSASVRFARTRNPWLVQAGSVAQSGWEIPRGSLPVSLANIHSDYEDVETSVSLFTSAGPSLKLTFVDNSKCFLTTDGYKRGIRSAGEARREFSFDIACFPTLGPLEEEETLLTPEYVAANEGGRRAHRIFRNIWYRRPREEFDRFKTLVEKTWDGMEISAPELHGYGNNTRLSMFCREGRVDRELCWAGFGFQVWLQILTQFVGAQKATLLVVDEPEIYLHPDLQHRLFGLLKNSGKQIVLATHSVEIVNEAEHDEVLLVNRRRKSAQRVTDIDGLQQALFSIGSAQNIHLAKLSKGKKILFLEGQDFKLLKRFALKLGFSALAEDVSLTVVPIGGFEQRQRISDAAWTFEKVLKADIKVAALLDRDYRSDDEVQALVDATRATVSDFHVLRYKELENYLLVPRALADAVRDKLRERDVDETSVDDAWVRTKLCEIADAISDDVQAQLFQHEMRYRGITHKSKDSATITAESLRAIKKKWSIEQQRLGMVPGKTVLARFNQTIQEMHGVSVTPALIVRFMLPEDVPECLASTIKALDAFVADKEAP